MTSLLMSSSTVTASEQNTCDHQGLAPSNLHLTISASADSSTLQLLDTTAQTLMLDVNEFTWWHSRCRYSDLQDVCMAIESLTTLDLPMVVDSIGIYELKGPYYTLTMTDWFLQALSVIPRGSLDDVARRFTMVRWVYQKNVFSDSQ
ncbi:aldose 1-epimerase-like [Dorcoceras hygrometricum]|uniref:Aldose 1-epimerase-like n=1 Tax=Dorcoceras hygrometricum TaxID=472368 RepID=A0A2Z7CKQ1_9LAMI|nr:aldose 1-epimerase-like [Dorcoceras hygrometricum]